MLFDDYEWPTEADGCTDNHVPYRLHPNHPQPGIDAFMSVFALDPNASCEVVAKGYQVLVRKLEADGELDHTWRETRRVSSSSFLLGRGERSTTTPTRTIT